MIRLAPEVGISADGRSWKESRTKPELPDAASMSTSDARGARKAAPSLPYILKPKLMVPLGGQISSARTGVQDGPPPEG
jgi:hypothetical protein